MKNLKIEDNQAVLHLNPKVYSLETIYSAAYVLLDKAYVLLDGDPASEIIVRIKSKDPKADIEKMGGEFLNELINYGDYKNRAESTKNIREAILQRALFTNDPEYVAAKTGTDSSDFDALLKELDKEDAYLDDPQGIAIPWEEKYGKKESKDGKDNSKQ